MDDDRAYNLAVRYLAKRPRSIREMVSYLKKRGIDPTAADQAVGRLIENRYLDDESFAQLFIEHRIRFKPKSKLALEYELKAKGIDLRIIARLLAPHNDLELALTASTQRLRSIGHLESDLRAKKLINYLRYRGFSYQVCQEVLNRMGLDS